MAFSYNKLWELLSQKGMNKTMLKEKIGISSSTLAKLSSNKIVSLDILSKICDKLDCKIEDIIEYKSEMREYMESLKDDFEDCGYTLYIDKFPRCYFKLSDEQAKKYKEDIKKIDNMLVHSEFEANLENQPNAGIIGTTRKEFYSENNKLVISGSFAVTKIFITKFIEMCKNK